MNPLRRALRLLLIVGLVPAVAAAGLPLRACPCVSGSTSETCCRCCGPDSPCRGDGKCGCPCGAARRPCRGTSGPEGTGPTAGSPDVNPLLGCPCTSQPVPAAPAPSACVPAVQVGLPAAGHEAVTLPSAVPASAVPASAVRLRSALLPVPDLPTTLCALVI